MYTEPQKTLHSQSKLGENKKFSVNQLLFSDNPAMEGILRDDKK